MQLRCNSAHTSNMVCATECVRHDYRCKRNIGGSAPKVAAVRYQNGHCLKQGEAEWYCYLFTLMDTYRVECKI